MQNLINQLLEFYKEDPDDPFNSYALATEYLKSDISLAKYYFEELIENHPTYIATYYHLAALYVNTSEPEKAIKIYTDGIEMAKTLNKSHALMELKRSYQNFMDENED